MLREVDRMLFSKGEPFLFRLDNQQSTMDLSAVDLFCGAGGLTSGLEKAGITVEAGFDIDENCKYAFERNNEAEFVRCNLGEIAAEDPSTIGEYLDSDAEKTLVAGCAPCQPFSSLNNGTDRSQHEKYGLLSAFASIVEDVEPDFVVMENVYEVRNSPVYDDFVERLTTCGYNVNLPEDRRVYCPEFGIPQTRRRVVLLASRQDSLDIGRPPIRDPDNYPTVKDAIDELSRLAPGETDDRDPFHTCQDLEPINLERVEQSEPGGTWHDWDDRLRLDCHRKDTGSNYESVYGRMEPDAPAPTMTTQFYNLGSGRFGHYDTTQNRALSLREGAMIQTFDRDYEFAASVEDVGITEIGRLIGNAVPPKLGEIVGNRILEFLRGEDVQRALGSYST